MEEQIISLLDDLRVSYHRLDHEAVFTVREASSLPKEHFPVKNLLIQEEGNGKKYLVVMSGNERLNIKATREELGSKKLRFANSETLMQTFGVSPGSVSIFGFLHPGSQDVTVLVDEKLINTNDELGFHPNDNTVTIFFAARFLEPILVKMSCSYLVKKLY